MLFTRLQGTTAIGLVLAALTTTLPSHAFAADVDATVPAASAPPVTTWASTITHSLIIEGGISGNPDSPSNGRNFGQLFTDAANRPVFNQVLFDLARPVDDTKQWDFGFNIQGLYGSDGRYDPTLGILDYAFGQDRNQLIFLNANIVVHSPFLTAGGIDTKIGLMPGELGYETIDPTQRPFYTFSYISNFLLAFQTVGVLSTWHVTPTLDIIGGVDSGNEVSFWRDNNSEPAGYFGFGLNNLLNNKLTVTAVSRIGPEDPVKTLGPAANSDLRFWNDVTATYKATDKWTFVFEGNYFKDDGLKDAYGSRATAYGMDLYASYAFRDDLTLNARAELYRDNTGLLTTSYLSNTAFTSALAGNPDLFQNAPPTTYGALTGGITYKPPVLNTKDYKVSIRPEVRYDTSLNDTHPFNNLTTTHQWLFSSDIIVAF